jgi:hypothetical protein
LNSRGRRAVERVQDVARYRVGIRVRHGSRLAQCVSFQ